MADDEIFEIDRALMADFCPGAAESPFEWRPHRWDARSTLAEKRTFLSMREMFNYLTEREYRTSGIIISETLELDHIGPNTATGWDEWAIIGFSMKNPQTTLLLGYTNGDPRLAEPPARIDPAMSDSL